MRPLCMLFMYYFLRLVCDLLFVTLLFLCSLVVWTVSSHSSTYVSISISLLCGCPNRPQYRSCPSVRLSVCLCIRSSVPYGGFLTWRQKERRKAQIDANAERSSRQKWLVCQVKNKACTKQQKWTELNWTRCVHFAKWTECTDILHFS